MTGVHAPPVYAQLHDRAFHADPGAAYNHLRATYGRVAPVEIAPGVMAAVALDYDLIRSICQNRTGSWTRKTSRWSAWSTGQIHPGSEITAMVGEWPNVLFAEGGEHQRLRSPVVDALGRVDMRELQERTERFARDLIGRFARHGQAELISAYAVLLPLMVMSDMFGLDDIERWLLPDIMRRIWDGDNAAQAAEDLSNLMSNTVERHLQGDASGPVTTGLLAHQGTMALDEIVATLVLMVGAGSQPAANLIANTVHAIVASPPIRAGLRNASLSVASVMHHTLWTQPPIAHYPPVVACREVTIDGVVVPAGGLVLLGLAAAGHQLQRAHTEPLTNRAYVAFGVGEHQCPAAAHAQRIAQIAVEMLFSELPDLRLSVGPDQLSWRPSPFLRALDRLPIQFTARTLTPPTRKGGDPAWHHAGNSHSAPTSTVPSPRGSWRWARWFRSRSRTRSRHGQ